jgi:2-hydroxychromene-2-carboxylate isomerase
MTTAELFYDYVSPFSYLAYVQLDGLCSRTGVEIAHRPTVLGGIFKAAGNTSPIQDPCEAKRGFVLVTLQRWVAHHRAPFRMNPHFPLNSVPALRCAVAAQGMGVFDQANRALFRAMWADGVDLADPGEIERVLAAAGLDAKAILDASGTDAAKSALRANTDEAVARGAFGAPSFFVDDQMFWGQDQIVLLEDHLKAMAA